MNPFKHPIRTLALIVFFVIVLPLASTLIHGPKGPKSSTLIQEITE